MLRTPRRAIAGLVALSAAVLAGLLVSPSATAAAAASVAADPVLFGLVVAGLYLVRPLFAWPTTPLAVVVGYGFGVAVGVPIALIGVVATVIPVFLAASWATNSATDAAETAPATAREARSPAVSGSVGRLCERTGAAIGRYYETAGPIRGVVASRLAPIPSDAATAAAAVAGVRLRHLVIGTAIGELPWTAAAVVVGASAATLSTDGLGGVGATVAIGCSAAAALLLAGPAYRLLRSESTASESTTPSDA